MVADQTRLSQEDPIRILVAGDRKLVCAGVRAIFSGNPLWEICGEAKNGKVAVSKSGKLKPDLVLLDLRTIEGDGFEFLSKIQQIAPTAKLISLTASECRQLECAARRGGADAVIAKRMLSNNLLNTLERQFSFTTSNLYALLQPSFDRNDGS